MVSPMKCFSFAFRYYGDGHHISFIYLLACKYYPGLPGFHHYSLFTSIQTENSWKNVSPHEGSLVPLTSFCLSINLQCLRWSWRENQSDKNKVNHTSGRINFLLQPAYQCWSKEFAPTPLLGSTIILQLLDT